MDIRSLFEISLPVIQAPMAGSQNHQLAAAVSGLLSGLSIVDMTVEDAPLEEVLADLFARHAE